MQEGFPDELIAHTGISGRDQNSQNGKPIMAETERECFI